MKPLHALLTVLGTAAVVVCLIYLTPLKWMNLVTPTMHEIDPAALNAAIAANPDGYVFIDVRTADVYKSAHAAGAINIPIANLYTQHTTLPKSGKKIALICTNGVLAAVAYGYLQYWGFTNLLHVTGGLQLWTSEGLPTKGVSIFAVSTSTAQ